MRNHIADLPLSIKQATDELNRLISMLYDIAAPSSSSSSISLDIARDQEEFRSCQGYVHVSYQRLHEEKIEILTSQATVPMHWIS
jgi:hypothetical protein